MNDPLLTSLELSDLDDATVIAFAEALRVNTTLVSLTLIFPTYTLSKRKYGRSVDSDVSFRPFAEALKENVTLASLKIISPLYGRILFNEKVYRPLAEALKVNRSLTCLSLSDAQGILFSSDAVSKVFPMSSNNEDYEAIVKGLFLHVSNGAIAIVVTIFTDSLPSRSSSARCVRDVPEHCSFKLFSCLLSLRFQVLFFFDDDIALHVMPAFTARRWMDLMA